MVSKARKGLISCLVTNCASALVLCSLVAGCEAELKLNGVRQAQVAPILRTDQFLAVSKSADDTVIGFAENGIVIFGMGDDKPEWRRKILAPASAGEVAPDFIASSTCAGGAVLGLSFQNEIWRFEKDDWSVEPVDTQEQLQDVFCGDDNSTWVSGAFGTLMVKPDSGGDWVDKSFFDDFTLTAMSFISDASAGYAVGEFGSIVKSLDAGITWEFLDPIADDFYPLDVHFTNEHNGWVSGVLGVIYATLDGGNTWQKQETETDASIYGFVEVDERLFAFGDLGTLLEFVPSSNKWVVHAAPKTAIHFAAAIPFNKGLVLVGGNGLVEYLEIGKAANGKVSNATIGARL